MLTGTKWSGSVHRTDCDPLNRPISMDSPAVLLADLAVRHAIAIVHHLDFSGAFMGLTILSIATSIPEIMTHIIGSIAIVQNPACLDPLFGSLIGTDIGSDIFQQNFVMPLVGIVGTIVVVRQELAVEVGAVIGATLLVLILCLWGRITRHSAIYFRTDVTVLITTTKAT